LTWVEKDVRLGVACLAALKFFLLSPLVAFAFGFAAALADGLSLLWFA
jgi:hypothetical protein